MPGSYHLGSAVSRTTPLQHSTRDRSREPANEYLGVGYGGAAHWWVPAVFVRCIRYSIGVTTLVVEIQDTSGHALQLYCAVEQALPALRSRSQQPPRHGTGNYYRSSMLCKLSSCMGADP